MLAGRAGEIVSRQETPSQCGRVERPAKGQNKCLTNPGYTDNKQVIKKCVYQYWNTLGKMSINLKGDELLETKRMVNDLKANNTDNDTKAVLDKIDLNLDDVKEALSQCKNNKSPRLDQITNELIKNGWGFSYKCSVQNYEALC